MAPRVLTNKQLAIFEFIKQYFDAHQRSPLIREIQEGCHIISYKSVVDKLLALEKKGFIERRANKHRGILLKDDLASASQRFVAREALRPREPAVDQMVENGLVQADKAGPSAPS